MEYKRQLALRVLHDTFPGYDYPLQRQPQDHRPGFTILFDLDELPVSIMSLKWTTVYMLFPLFTHIITY